MRQFAIGDIHGAYKALIQCLQRCEFNKEYDQLISLGDVADGWSQVTECVEELLTIQNLISIRGNHDVWCWNWFTNGQSPTMWVQQGGKATIKAYIDSEKLTDTIHRNFWNNQIDYYIDDQNRLFVHGGFNPYDGWQVSLSRSVNIPRAKEIHWDRELWELPDKISPSIQDNLNIFKEIYIGHSAHIQNLNKHNIWNLDTGAGWDGKLTIMDINTKKVYQSDIVKTLYPNELGR